MSSDYTVTFACLNQLEYTKQLLESLVLAGTDVKRIIAVNNASRDDTHQYLCSLGLGGVVNNKTNLGCGTAWNQGVLALQSEWSIVVNNDVLVPPNFVENLIQGAKAEGLLVASPGMIEAPKLSYDLTSRATHLTTLFNGYVRPSFLHGVCLLVHQSVWQRVGYFRSKPRLLGFEDSLFFRDLQDHEIPRGTVSSTWIHHFGSITQKGLKKERRLPPAASLGDRTDYELHRDGWFARKLRKFKSKRAEKNSVAEELLRFQETIIQSGPA